MAPPKKIYNAQKRSEVHRKSKREKGQEKLKRRMDIKKAEKEKGVGEELRKVSCVSGLISSQADHVILGSASQ